MVTVRWSAGVLSLLCMVLVLVRMQADGLLLLATVFFGVWLWSFGVFSRDWWIADAETSARLSAIDAELDFADDVAADLAALDTEYPAA